MPEAIYNPGPWREVSEVFSVVTAEQRRDWWMDAIGLDKAHEESQGEGIVVGVIDTGVDDSHPDLDGRVISHANFSRSRSDKDVAGHGTAVSYLVLQAAPKVKIRSYKALGDDGNGTNSAVAAAVKQGQQDGCHILNLSLGSPIDDPILRHACLNAIEDGVVVNASAGNSGPTNRHQDFPGAIAPVIAWAGIDRNGSVSRFSSRGLYVDYAAAATDVLAAKAGGGWVRFSGTSFSCPIGSGLESLILSTNTTLDLDGLNKRLKAACVDPDEPGHGPETGWGIVHGDKLRLNGNGKEVPVTDGREFVFFQDSEPGDYVLIGLR